MPSFATILRAAVMLATAVILVKGWERYGPSSQQVKTWTAQIVERAHNALSERPQLAPARAEPFSIAKTIEQLPAALPNVVSPTPDRFEEGEFLTVPPLSSNVVQAPGPAASDVSQKPEADTVDSDRMPMLLARLDQLGAVEPQLVAWGTSGELYRFCCRAALPSTPNFTRHFESVAAEPLVAVQQVVAKVEAWRSEQPVWGQLR